MRCEHNKHQLPEFPCMKSKCDSTLCLHCAPDPDMYGKVYCRLCRFIMSASNLGEEDSGDDDKIEDARVKSRHRRTHRIINDTESGLS